MEKVISDTFLTTPTFKSYQPSETQQKLPENLRQKIINILKSFKEKQFLNQAINNIGIPKNFVNIPYVESRTEHQLAKIYATVCSLKKQVLRIKKYSDPSHGTGNLAPIQSHKLISQSNGKCSDKKKKDPIFLFLKKQLQPQAKIKLAIEKQLLYRQKLQNLSKKGESAQKIKLELLQKRKETAKFMNKKAIEVYQRQKQNQQKWFEKILQSNIELQNSSNSLTSSVQRNFNSANSTRRHQYHDLVKQRLQRQKLQFQTHLQLQVIERLQKQTSVKEFKHKRMNSLNDRILFTKMKSMEIRERKINTAQEQEALRLRKIIQKEKKFLKSKNNKTTKDNRNSELTQNQCQTTAFITNQNFFRANETRIANFQKEDEKENMIIEKIARKNEIKQILINEKVQKMKEKHRLEESRRETFKQSKAKLFTEIHDNSESFVYQKGFFGGKSPATLTEASVCDKQEQNIRKKHQNTLKNVSCDQSILKLRKLPKFVLENKLKDIKNKQLSDMLAQDIVKFLI